MPLGRRLFRRLSPSPEAKARVAWLRRCIHETGRHIEYIEANALRERAFNDPGDSNDLYERALVDSLDTTRETLSALIDELLQYGHRPRPSASGSQSGDRGTWLHETELQTASFMEAADGWMAAGAAGTLRAIRAEVAEEVAFMARDFDKEAEDWKAFRRSVTAPKPRKVSPAPTRPAPTGEAAFKRARVFFNAGAPKRLEAGDQLASGLDESMGTIHASFPPLHKYGGGMPSAELEQVRVYAQDHGARALRPGDVIALDDHIFTYTGIPAIGGFDAVGDDEDVSWEIRRLLV